MNNNKKHNDLQFTELTPEDAATHEDLYVDLLAGGKIYIFDGKYRDIYNNYRTKELQKAKHIFCKTFGI